MWEGIVTEELGLAYGWPRWLKQPAIGRVTISSPHLLAPFSSFNRGKAYLDQITPFTFLLSAHVAPFGHPEGVDPKRFHLFAPYTSDPDQWLKLSWIDAHSKNQYRISTTVLSGSEFTVRVKTIGEVLAQYRHHPEAKSLGSNGKPCGSKTVGVLARRPVIALYLTHIGKESNRLEDVEARFVHDLDEVSTEYRDTCRDPFITLVLPVLRTMPRAHLLKETGLSKNALKKVLAGGARAQSRTMVMLTRAASRFASTVLKSQGCSVPSNDLAVCYKYLHMT